MRGRGLRWWLAVDVRMDLEESLRQTAVGIEAEQEDFEVSVMRAMEGLGIFKAGFQILMKSCTQLCYCDTTVGKGRKGITS
eukprot:scaffold145709_cov15-Tisochrysis_lutea.AAC.1